jgi:hypothetical protein
VTGSGLPRRIASSPSIALAALLALPALPGGESARGAGASFGVRAPAARLAQAPSDIAVSPQPNTPDVSPRTQISFLGAPADALGAITVVGSRTGHHLGSLHSYAAAPGASYVLDRRFASGETVRVRVDPKPGGLTAPLSFSFTVARPSAFPAPPRTPVSVGRRRTQSFRSDPGLHPPQVFITRSLAGQAPGDIFVGAISHLARSGNAVSQQGPMIFDSKGRLVYFRPLPGRLKAENFRVQDLHGAPVLTWWQGRINPLGFGQGEGLIYDSSYRLVARVPGGNGERPDLHEFVVDPDGTAWVTAYVPVRADLRPLGGPANGSLLDSIVQEIDIKTGLVMFEWHPLGHVPLRESYSRFKPGFSINPYHINSIQLLSNNTILLSARDTWSVYDVSITTGKILGRLGGKHSTFRLGPGARFAYQHDAQAAPDGTVSLFDDEASPVVGHQSRGLVLGLDLSSQVAAVVHQYLHANPPLLTGSQGSMQNLANGDEFVGWGGEPYFSEYAADGRLLFDGHLPRGVQSYRAYRFPWVGRPHTRPSAAARNARGGQVVVYASWNGATEVSRWQVLDGPDPLTIKPIATASPAGFETAISVHTSQPLVAVRALDASGVDLGTSLAVRH